MNFDRLRPALVVLLGVLAISAAAASMDGAQQTQIAGPGSGDGSGVGDGSGAGVSASQSAATFESETIDVWNWLQPALAVLFAGGAIAYLCYAALAIWRDGIDGVRQILVHAITTIVPAGIAYLILFGAQLSQWAHSQAGALSTSAAPEFEQGGGSTNPDAVDTATQVPSLVVIVGSIVVLAVVALLLVHLLDDGDDSSGTTTDAVETGERTVHQPVHVDTQTAIADVDATNDVYRAWRELASAVDGVDLRTHTPAEIADRASERGFDQEAVRTITDLFEEVRYGQRPPTSERESRARSALDRLLPERDGR